jgi:hypothetical protein
MPTTVTTDTKVLEKVHNLVKLAASGDTAAAQATKLMKEHELVLVPRPEIMRAACEHLIVALILLGVIDPPET